LVYYPAFVFLAFTRFVYPNANHSGALV